MTVIKRKEVNLYTKDEIIDMYEKICLLYEENCKLQNERIKELEHALEEALKLAAI